MSLVTECDPLLEELYRRLRYGPIVLRDSGDFCQVAGIVSNYFPDPRPGILYRGLGMTEYTLSSVKAIVLYPPSCIGKEIYVAGETIVPLEKFGKIYTKHIFPSFEIDKIEVRNMMYTTSSCKATVYYGGDYITTVGFDKMISYDFGRELLDYWQIDWSWSLGGDKKIYAIPDIHDAVQKYCEYNPFELFG